MLFHQGSIVSNRFSKNRRKMKFFLEFSSIIFKILSISQNSLKILPLYVFFFQTTGNLKDGIKNCLKIVIFSFIFKNIEKLLQRTRGSTPGPPTGLPPYKLSHDGNRFPHKENNFSATTCIG